MATFTLSTLTVVVAPLVLSLTGVSAEPVSVMLALAEVVCVASAVPLQFAVAKYSALVTTSSVPSALADKVTLSSSWSSHGTCQVPAYTDSGAVTVPVAEPEESPPLPPQAASMVEAAMQVARTANVVFMSFP